jgi:hypothetical protein
MEDEQQTMYRIVPREGLSAEDRDKVEKALDLVTEFSVFEFDGSPTKEKAIDLSTTMKKRKKLQICNYASSCGSCSSSKKHRGGRKKQKKTSRQEDEAAEDHNQSDTASDYSGSDEVKEKPTEPQWCRSKILLTRNMMEHLADNKSKAYRLTAKDNQCPRQLRMFAKTARQSYECRDFFQNQVIKVITPQHKVIELPLNGRHSLRYAGAMEERGRALVTAILSLNFEWPITVTFMKDCGFGSKSARKIIDEFYPPDKQEQAEIQIDKAEKLIQSLEALVGKNNAALAELNE